MCAGWLAGLGWVQVITRLLAVPVQDACAALCCSVSGWVGGGWVHTCLH
jgi:hypothetical protein